MFILNLILLCFFGTSTGVSIGTSHIINDFDVEYSKTIHKYNKIKQSISNQILLACRFHTQYADQYLNNTMYIKNLEMIMQDYKKPSEWCYFAPENADRWNELNNKINKKLDDYDDKIKTYFKNGMVFEKIARDVKCKKIDELLNRCDEITKKLDDFLCTCGINGNIEKYLELYPLIEFDSFRENSIKNNLKICPLKKYPLNDDIKKYLKKHPAIIRMHPLYKDLNAIQKKLVEEKNKTTKSDFSWTNDEISLINFSHNIKLMKKLLK